MNSRYLTLNTVIRKYTIETTRTDHEMPYSSAPDEADLHDEDTIIAFSDAVRRGFPEAKLTWAFSWQALVDKSVRYEGIRQTVRQMHERYGDDVTFIPGGYFANVYNSRPQVNSDLTDALQIIQGFMDGYRSPSVVAGFLAADNIRYLREQLGIATVQGNIWSQYAVDAQDGDGSPAYPYYPSKQHFCKPAQGADDFIDCLNLDGWTVDLVAARLSGEYHRDGVRYVSRMGVGPLETLHTFDLETGLRQMQATTQAHYDTANVERNPFGWITNNYEISCVHQGRRLGALDAFSEWLRWLKATWSDVQCPTMASFGKQVRTQHPDNDSLTYLLRQDGTGIGASFAGQQVTWFMNKSFRLGIVRTHDALQVFDYTDYRQPCHEPQGVGQRNWSLLGEINQKQRRPQDQPLSGTEFFARYPHLRDDLLALYGRRTELHDILSAC